jgi:hypothetical protein
MKSLLAGLVVFGLAFSVNAGDVHNAGTSQYVHSFIPVCPEGYVAEFVKVNGVYRWECVPI